MGTVPRLDQLSPNWLKLPWLIEL
ncbi:unnamed protein product, partial [Rotaria magnacalcarata]